MAFGMQAVLDTMAAAEQRAKAAASDTSWSGNSLNYFNWKPGDKKILRFLTDDLLTEDFYRFVLDKDGKPASFLINPADPNCFQRYMSPTPGIGWTKKYKSEMLEHPKPVKMSATIAVLRREEPDPDNPRRMVIKDDRHDREVKDGTLPSLTFGVVLERHPILESLKSTFWTPLSKYWSRNDTICDCDFEISREGNDYSILPLPKVEELSTPEAVVARYFYGQPWDENDPKRFLKCPQTIHQWADYYGSEERYRKFLVPDDQKTTAAKSHSYTPSGIDEFASDEAQSSSFSSIRDTLLKQHKKEPKIPF